VVVKNIGCLGSGSFVLFRFCSVFCVQCSVFGVCSVCLVFGVWCLLFGVW